jgi:hypothetical protein
MASALRARLMVQTGLPREAQHGNGTKDIGF